MQVPKQEKLRDLETLMDIHEKMAELELLARTIHDKYPSTRWEYSDYTICKTRDM